MHGGYLAEITSKEETDLLNMFILAEQYHWIGLNDLASPGNWRWQHSYVSANYTNWRQGQPNESSTCALIDPNYEQTWADYDCLESSYSSGNIHALCEAYNQK